MIPSKLLAEKPAIVRALKITVSDLKRTIERDRDEYLDGEIDIRLCVDGDSRWIIRHGLVDYDPYHSEFCSSSFVTQDTDADELADELIGEVLDQHAERETD